jgi:hypothetical protein
MLVLRYIDGSEELEEEDFIDLSENEVGQSTFRMKGGHKVGDQDVIILAELCGPRITIRVLKKRSHIT